MFRTLVALVVVAGSLAYDRAAPSNFAGQAEVHDETHIKQHLENKIEVDKLSEDQQRFHYFSMHDLNKDNFIDGIEILKAITHDHESDTPGGQKIEDEDKLITMIDGVLADLDVNGDGGIDYAEYIRKYKGT